MLRCDYDNGMASGGAQEALTIAKKALATDGLLGEKWSQLLVVSGSSVLLLSCLSPMDSSTPMDTQANWIQQVLEHIC